MIPGLWWMDGGEEEEVEEANAHRYTTSKQCDDSEGPARQRAPQVLVEAEPPPRALPAAVGLGGGRRDGHKLTMTLSAKFES